ncbi:MAG: hypothetical protein HYT89_00190 [Candidatus Omnitrophica bacterium]|nr:hypothetical protein [Candidatus Omnitrophota bacterium]
MKKRALLFLVVFSAAAAIPAAAVEYLGKAYRDPFGLTPGTGRIAKGPVSGLKAQGIVWNTENPRAIVNNKMVKIGSKIGSAVVTGIDKKGVWIREADQEFILRPGGKETP